MGAAWARHVMCESAFTLLIPALGSPLTTVVAGVRGSYYRMDVR